MALLKFENVGLRAISATVPHRVVKTREMTDYYSEEEIEKPGFDGTTGQKQLNLNKLTSDQKTDKQSTTITVNPRLGKLIT